jgi:hypothetical protein
MLFLPIRAPMMFSSPAKRRADKKNVSLYQSDKLLVADA